jgi:stringent starvation protein B
VKDVATKPYLLRAIYEWCCDNGYTPHISVRVTAETKVPSQYVKNGEIVLNISQTATRNLTLGNEWIQFSARFNGVSHELTIPVDAVAAVFARENAQGLLFQTAQEESRTIAGPKPVSEPDPRRPGSGKARLQVIK